MYEYRAHPIEVHDGDTFTATIDLGFRTYIVWPVRMEGLFAPELHEAHGEDAYLALKGLVFPDGARAELVLRSKKAGENMSFQRYVFQVLRVEQDGSLKDLATAMASMGFQGQGRGVKK